MDNNLLKKLALQSVALMLTVITLSYTLNQYNKLSITRVHSAEAASVKDLEPTAEHPEATGITPAPVQVTKSEEKDYNKQDSGLSGKLITADINRINRLGEKVLIIKKPKVSDLKISLEDLYLTRCIRITLTGSQNSHIDSSYIGRINRKDSFVGAPVYEEYEEVKIDSKDGTEQTLIKRDYGADVVHGISITDHYYGDREVYNTELLLELDTVYAHIIEEDDEYYYIGLQKPSDVYSKILVIDAGHGGKDAGALSRDESIYEKNINIKILLQLKELLDKENIKVYYTRLMDDKVFLRPRVELANAVDCDFFISIHCNASVSTEPSGTEIYYYDTNYKQVNNEQFANIFSEELALTTSLKKRGIMKQQDDDIFILNNARVPAIIVETGYITNAKDLKYLLKEENQQKIAQGIYNGIMRSYQEFSR